MVDGKSHLRTWVDERTRQRFAAVAAEQGISESALLRRLVDRLLMASMVSEPEPDAVLGDATFEPRDARLTVRLMADDRLVLRERAAARGMPMATYVSALVRSHLRSLPPLPVAEHHALKATINELTAVGRNLNQLVRIAHQERRVTGLTIADLKLFLKLCEVLRERTKALLKANADSWRTGVNQPQR
jgi:predicted ATPase with chaperone activity